MGPALNPAHLLNRGPSPSAQRSLTILGRSEELHRGYCSILDFSPSFPDAGRSSLDQYRMPLSSRPVDKRTIADRPERSHLRRRMKMVPTSRDATAPHQPQTTSTASFDTPKFPIPPAPSYHFGFAMITAPERSRESAKQALSPIKRCRSGVETGLFSIEIPGWFRAPVYRPPSKTDKRP